MSFNIVINSEDRVSGTTNDANYFFDWGQLKECAYRVYFQGITEASTGGSSDLSPIFVTDLINNNDLYTSRSSYTGFLGVMEDFYAAAVTDAFSFRSQNSPIYLEARPNKNIFNIKKLDLSGSSFPTSHDYIIILKFVPVKKQQYKEKELEKTFYQ
jgi:hypothetical protein|tara:strand:- start:559 stop:1026 length:468 start_codon:yes stop_codon:yes gene_type:complete